MEARFTYRRHGEWVAHSTRHAVLLRSAPEDLDVRVQLELSWLLPPGSEPARDIEADACKSLTSTVTEVIKPFSVLHREEAESAANLALARSWSFQHLARARAALRVEPEAIEFARERMLRDLETRRRRAIQRAELDRLESLRETMLRDTATARLWWTGGDPAKLLQLTEHGDKFERALSLLASSPESAGASREEAVVAETVRDFLTGLQPEHRVFLLHQLVKVFSGYERPDLAARLNGQAGESPPGAASSPGRDR
ncbi:hypothetical protein AB0C18_03535 [Nonomuraea muscovyensis]|uniref:hypothetical protein n=1 Tax=Nonomuraea muscovyensis TaxID=1124761 RepID=UPI0033D5A3AD